VVTPIRLGDAGVRYAERGQALLPGAQTLDVGNGKRQVIQADPQLVERSRDRGFVVGDQHREVCPAVDEKAEAGILDERLEPHHLGPESRRGIDVRNRQRHVGDAEH